MNRRRRMRDFPAQRTPEETRFQFICRIADQGFQELKEDSAEALVTEAMVREALKELEVELEWIRHAQNGLLHLQEVLRNRSKLRLVK